MAQFSAGFDTLWTWASDAGDDPQAFPTGIAGLDPLARTPAATIPGTPRTPSDLNPLRGSKSAAWHETLLRDPFEGTRGADG